jgi:electron transfer flavoprotein alpha/beta subunit
MMHLWFQATVSVDHRVEASVDHRVEASVDHRVEASVDHRVEASVDQAVEEAVSLKDKLKSLTSQVEVHQAVELSTSQS